MSAKLIIFSAPSGAGKSTLVQHLLKCNFGMEFSISATSRPPRGTEKHGVEYYFLSEDEFRAKIANNEFLVLCEAKSIVSVPKTNMWFTILMWLAD